MTKCSKGGGRKIAPAPTATRPPKRRRATEDDAPALPTPASVEDAPDPPVAATTTSYLQLRNRSVMFVNRRARFLRQAAATSAATVEAEEGFSRCSSNAAGSDVVREESTRSFCKPDRARRETTPTSGLRIEDGDLESTAELRSSRQTTETRVMPTEAEIDEFLSAAEQVETRRFKEKYNFDVVNEVPLEGRYNWTRT